MSSPRPSFAPLSSSSSDIAGASPPVYHAPSRVHTPAIIIVFVPAFLCVAYILLSYTIKCFYRRCFNSTTQHDSVQPDSVQPDSLLQESARHSSFDTHLVSWVHASIPVVPFAHSSHNTECAVCLTSFQLHDPVRMLPTCRHAFHRDCIDLWLRSQWNCPLCREEIARITPDEPIKEQATRVSIEGNNTASARDRGVSSMVVQFSLRRARSMGSFNNRLAMGGVDEEAPAAGIAVTARRGSTSGGRRGGDEEGARSLRLNQFSRSLSARSPLSYSRLTS